MTFPVGTHVRSKRTDKIHGIVVGYGALSWPTPSDPDTTSGDGGIVHPVYLVQVREASTSLGPACAVLRADMVEEMP